MWYDILIDKLEEHLKKCPKHKQGYLAEELQYAWEFLHYETWMHGQVADICCPWSGCGWRYGGKLVLSLDLDSLGEEQE